MRTASGAVLRRSPRRGEMVHISHNRPPSRRQCRSLGVVLDLPSESFPPRNRSPLLSCANVLYSASGYLVLRDLSGLHDLGYMENNPSRGP
jgi:hypothetical protein